MSVMRESWLFRLGGSQEMPELGYFLYKALSRVRYSLSSLSGVSLGVR